MNNKTISIGGASGFWGDAARSTPQLLETPDLDYIVYDYLAEITMSIMARARAKDESKGYALDFVSVAMGANFKKIADKGIKVISNAGGVNPRACVHALRSIIESQGLELTVACVAGDDLLSQAEQFATADTREMFSGQAFPAEDAVLSINAYLGAFPIAEALNKGADIVVTGRCVDSAVTLGACIHEFGWQANQLDFLAMGSLAGHILECGPQATGGNFTDWQLVADRIHEIGYPIAEINNDGSFICTKPAGTGGLVSVGTVAEQMLYEIGDPQAYQLPDVTCDFSNVRFTQVAENRVLVEGATGRSVPPNYKVCATYADQFRGGTSLTFYGIDADKKAQALADAIFLACDAAFAQHDIPGFSETSVEMIGAESQFGSFKKIDGSREVAMKIAAKHPQAAGIGILLREAVGLGLATPPGLCGFQGGRPKPSPVVRLFSFELDKREIEISVEIDGQVFTRHALPDSAQSTELDRPSAAQPNAAQPNAAQPNAAQPSAAQAQKDCEMRQVKLIDLAWARSGDKGDKANIGVIARQRKYYPYILAELTEQVVEQRFEHFLEGAHSGKQVDRFLLPGCSALNFLLHNVLGGGGMASIRNDAQGKGFSQLLLDMPISIPSAMELG